MKKSLLFVSMVAFGMSAFAAEDITPAGYMFNNVTEFNYHSKASAKANPAVPAWNTYEGATYWDDTKGLVILGGNPAQFGSDPAAMTPNEQLTGPAHVIAGTSLLNMGGEIGQVLCINGQNSNLADKLAEAYGETYDIPKCDATPGWYNMNFLTNPNRNTKLGENEEEYLNFRCVITLNAYSNSIQKDNVIVDPYMVVNQGGHNQQAEKADAYDFRKFYDNDRDGDSEEDEDGNLIWDPECWMVYTDNYFVKADDADGNSFAPARMKFDMKADALMGGALLIKSVQFYNVPRDEASTDPKEIEFIRLKGGKPGAIETVAAESANFTVNGRTVTFEAAATVYTVSGAMVATVAAGEELALENGFYVARTAGKGVKFAIK